MAESEFNRRDFTQLTMAAFGGMLAGSLAGCAKSEPEGAKAPSSPAAPGAATPTLAAKGDKEIHLCRGLNTCKGKGASGTNDCAGQGDCATAEHQTCGGK